MSKRLHALSTSPRGERGGAAAADVDGGSHGTTATAPAASVPAAAPPMANGDARLEASGGLPLLDGDLLGLGGIELGGATGGARAPLPAPPGGGAALEISGLADGPLSDAQPREARRASPPSQEAADSDTAGAANAPPAADMPSAAAGALLPAALPAPVTPLSPSSPQDAGGEATDDTAADAALTAVSPPTGAGAETATVDPDGHDAPGRANAVTTAEAAASLAPGPGPATLAVAAAPAGAAGAIALDADDG